MMYVNRPEPTNDFERWDQQQYTEDLIKFLQANHVVVTDGSLIQAAKQVAWDAAIRSVDMDKHVASPLENINLELNKFLQQNEHEKVDLTGRVRHLEIERASSEETIKNLNIIVEKLMKKVAPPEKPC